MNDEDYFDELDAGIEGNEEATEEEAAEGKVEVPLLEGISSIAIGKKGGVKREFLTRHQIAAYNLYKELEAYPEVNEIRLKLRDEFVALPSLPILNMKVLAAVLAFLTSVNNNPTPASFNSEAFTDITDILKNKLNDVDVPDYLIKTKATFLRYILNIIKFRTDR